MTIIAPHQVFHEEIQANVIALARSAHVPKTMILCFVDDEIPQYIDPMPRNPSPPTGRIFDLGFGDYLHTQISKNPALHDGAMVFQRNDHGFHLIGWSYRLCAPSFSGQPRFDNRGSAFNSCLTMSAVQKVHCLFLISAGQIWHFFNGDAFQISNTTDNLISRN